MNAHELKDRLIAEGCNDFLIHLGNEKRSLTWPDAKIWVLEVSGVDVLNHFGDIWKVYFQERGSVRPTMFESRSEKKACEYYFKLMMKRKSSHHIGTFDHESSIASLQLELEAIGVSCTKSKSSSTRNGSDVRVMVVSVYGKDIFKVKELYSDLPLSDDDF